MVAVVLLATPLVVMVKVAVVAPAATVTLAGSCAAPVLLLDKVTSAPPEGAGPFSMTVPLEVFPPATDVGFRVREDSATSDWAVNWPADQFAAMGVPPMGLRDQPGYPPESPESRTVSSNEPVVTSTYVSSEPCAWSRR